MLYITNKLVSQFMNFNSPKFSRYVWTFFRATEAADCKARNDDTKSLTHCNLEDHTNVHIFNCPTKPTNLFKLQESVKFIEMLNDDKNNKLKKKL